jgi:hypothetical protein
MVAAGKEQSQNNTKEVHEKRYYFKKDPVLVDIVHVPNTERKARWANFNLFTIITFICLEMLNVSANTNNYHGELHNWRGEVKYNAQGHHLVGLKLSGIVLQKQHKEMHNSQ